MKSEELKAIREAIRKKQWLAPMTESLCDEVERLQKQLEPSCLTEDWLADLANRCAYQIHRVIGNNIEHYRGQTAKELQSLIRAAITRNS